MEIKCVMEHNGNDTMLHLIDFVGAFTRGASLDAALAKTESEITAYTRWTGENLTARVTPVITQEWNSTLDICDADSDVIFNEERLPLSYEEYCKLKNLALKSAEDFLMMYYSIKDKHSSSVEPKNTFLGPRPRTAYEMYEHTKDVNRYYFGEIGISANNDGTIVECRKRGFELLEQQNDYLSNKVILGSFNEEWSLRKVLRRFIWHDRIHGKAMYRMAKLTFVDGAVLDTFRFHE